MRIRFICIHGHFYQPPRENPWLEAIETQDSAHPYHDWNERITAECYEPNASSRILDANDRIIKIVNNYASISFNFGPTLLSWLEQHEPSTYAAILEADRSSRERFGGHGNAIAQAYNHVILPLANARDKETQVRWGVRDFEKRFGRKPEGMWLPQTAARALAYGTDYINERKLARIANYGQFLAENPPAHDVEIVERTSWSCSHGVSRWQLDCGCHVSAPAGWNQQWRGPLRDALD